MKKFISNELGLYKLSLVKDRFAYYVNENESDENACVIMLDIDGNLISDNYFAYADYIEQLEKIVLESEKYEFVYDYALNQTKNSLNI